VPVRFCEYYISKHFEWSTDNATHNSAILPHTWKQLDPLKVPLVPDGHLTE